MFAKTEAKTSSRNSRRELATVFAIFVCCFFPLAQTQEVGANVLARISSPWYEEKKTWTLRPLPKRQYPNVTNLVDIQRLQRVVLPHFLVVRPPGSSGNQYVRGIIKTLMGHFLRWHVEEDAFIGKPPYPYGLTKFSNIIATFNPTAKRRLVLACHYDSKILPRNFIGATDSAVPCSMIIEVAVALKDLLHTSAVKDEITLQLIFFDGEEAFVRWSNSDSLYGSRHLADKWENTPWPANDPASSKTVLDSMDLLVLLDLLGAANPRFYNNQVVKSKYFEELIRIEKNLFRHNVYFRRAVLRDYVEDDHIPFHVRNVSTLHVIPSPFPRQWHTVLDDEKNLDGYTIKRLTDIITVFVCEYLRIAPSSTNS